MTVPPEATAAARAAVCAALGGDCVSECVYVTQAALEAAAPLIAAARDVDGHSAVYWQQQWLDACRRLDEEGIERIAGWPKAAAAERDRIRAAVTDIRDQARRLTQNMPPEIALGFNAQDEALTAVLDLLDGAP